MAPRDRKIPFDDPILATSDTEENEELQLDTVNLGQLALAAADETKPEEQLAAVISARIMVSLQNNLSSINYIGNSVLLPVLVQCLHRNDNPELQFEAAWTLTNIAAGASEQTNRVVRAGAVPILLELLKSSDVNVSGQAVWALGNIIGDGPELRDFVINHGIIEPLLSFAKPGTPTPLLRNVSWVIVNLCRQKQPLQDAITNDILMALKVLIDHIDTDVLANTLRAITCLAKIDSQIQLIVTSGVVPKLIPLLASERVKVQLSALHAIGCIASGTDEQTQCLLDCNLMSHFTHLLSNRVEKIRERSIWLLANISGGNQSHIQAVIDEGIIPKIIDHLSHGKFRIKKEAVFAINNFVSRASSDQVSKLLSYGVLPPFAHLQTCRDTEVVEMVRSVLPHLKEINTQDSKIVGSL